jgi:citrate/tricarballylate utilization protein
MLDEFVAEANRQLSICNACRYCEGLCSVFPAIEQRTAFHSGDISYLSSLCHDCGACVPACPFSPPHEFAVDIRSLMADVRVQTFEEYAWPQALWRVLARGRSVLGIVVATAIFATIVALATGDPGRILDSHTESGSFYDIIAWAWLVVPASIISVFAIAAILVGVRDFARQTPTGTRSLLRRDVQARTLRDVLSLLNLDGGGVGCETVGDQLSSRRRWLHHGIFYGFGLMFAATVVAGLEQDVLGIKPPYPFISAPVLLGTIGGLATIIGVGGFVVIGFRRSRRSVTGTSTTRRFDRVFSVTLLAATVTGLLVLALRSTSAMGIVLIAHLGTLGGLLVTLPYSKFVHGFYRYVALARFHAESIPATKPTPHRPDSAALEAAGLPATADVGGVEV